VVEVVCRREAKMDQHHQDETKNGNPESALHRVRFSTKMKKQEREGGLRRAPPTVIKTGTIKLMIVDTNTSKTKRPKRKHSPLL